MAAKVFNISLHRCGTQSFHQYMGAHGFSAVHYPGWQLNNACKNAVEGLDTKMVWESIREIVSQNDAFSDIPYCFLYREALEAYPDAKFVLMARTPIQWVASVRNHIKERRLEYLEKIQYWTNTPNRREFITEYSDTELEGIFINHICEIHQYMIDNKAHFRIFNLSDSSLGAKLGEFIGFETTRPFKNSDYLRSV